MRGKRPKERKCYILRAGDGTVVEVTREVYLEWYQSRRRARYQNEKKQKYGVFSLEALSEKGILPDGRADSPNGWSIGRQTTDGLMGYCAQVSPSEAKPGDLIFFQGTYNTSGASHIGIYVGNGMMIHCGDPVQYANINSSYWQQHFMCYGRLP